VGESGCGKSTVADSIIGALDRNGYVSSGEIYYKGEEIHNLTKKELNKTIRWKEISWIPQASMSALDPLETIKDQAVEIGKVHTDLNEQEIMKRLRELFSMVGLPEDRIFEYPFQFSGGMQQRAVIAFSLLLEPELIIADEPTTALDVILQDKIFAHLERINEDFDTSMMLITHDISLIFESCERLAVMHAGQLAEIGTLLDLYLSPGHPYTMLLQDAFPDVGEPGKKLESIDGQPPQLKDEVNFCTFYERCPWAEKECHESAPSLETLQDGAASHAVSCFRKDEIDRIAYKGDDK